MQFKVLLVGVAIGLQAVGLSAQMTVSSSTTLSNYVGGYELAPGLVARMIVTGDRLFLVSPLGTRTELVPKSETTFVTKPDGVSVVFTKDANARVTHISVGSPPTEKATRIVVKPDKLSKYVGNYPLSPQLSMAVTLEGDQLMVQATGQSKHPIYPLSATKFFVQDSASNDTADLEFAAEQGPSSFVIFRQGGSEQKVIRK